MRVAYLIMGHRDPQQILRLMNALRSSAAFFVIHIDKRAADSVFAPLREYAAGRSDVFLAPRIRCYWGSFGIANAMVECVKTAVKAGAHFDYAILLSAQDYPIKSGDEIKGFLEKNQGAEFIESFELDKPNRWTSHAGPYQAMNRVGYWTFFLRSRPFHLRIPRRFPFGWRPFGGSQWWGLSRECVLYLENTFRTKPEVIRYFRHVFIPDESLFQTVIANETRFSGRIVNNDLRHIDWDRPNPKYPRTLDMEDFERLRDSPKLFARKFEIERSRDLLDRVDAELLSNSEGG
ncbi:MAG TPA: beta-1,6-N-acetylglucosaminyltransferase [Silvibacterium sp.]|nr:beta-1,6-N-acetylglucosaminyltransferase [Silvibacterium sp.]